MIERLFRRFTAGRRAAVLSRDGLPATLSRDKPLIPVDSAASRALVAVIAILTFLAALAAGAAQMVAGASSEWRSAVSNEMTIQIRPEARRDIDEDVTRAAQLAAGAPGVQSIRIVAREEGERLLEPWLGSGLGLSELPVPRLIVITLARSSRPDVDALRQSLRREVPTASLDDHRIWIERLSTMANTLIVAGVSIVLLIVTAAALAVAFATRGAMAGSQDSIEVLHLVGADDDFIAREFQTRFLRLGLEGGAIGGGAALVATGLLGWLSASWASGPGADQVQALFGAFEIGWVGYLTVIAAGVAVAAIAGLVSRITVRRTLARIA